MTNLCHVCGIGDGSFVLHTRPRSKGSFFPFLSTSNKSHREGNDSVGCCAVCKAFLKEQWNSFEKLKIPIYERTYWVKSWGNNEDDESYMSSSVPNNEVVKKVFKTEKVDANDRLKTPDNNMVDYKCQHYADINASPLHFNGNKKRKLSRGFEPNIKKARHEDNICIKDYSIERLTKKDSLNINYSGEKIDLKENEVLDLSKPLRKQNNFKCLSCSCEMDSENNKENEALSTCKNCFSHLKNTQKNSLQNAKMKNVQHSANNDVPSLDISSLLNKNGFKRCGTLHQNQALQNAFIQNTSSISRSLDDINVEGKLTNINNKTNQKNKTSNMQEANDDVRPGDSSIDTDPLNDTLHAALGLIFLQHSQQHLKAKNINNHYSNVSYNESLSNFPITTQQLTTKEQLTTLQHQSTSQIQPKNITTCYKSSNKFSQLSIINKEEPNTINSNQTSKMYYGNNFPLIAPNKNICINNNLNESSTINNDLNRSNVNINYLNINGDMVNKKVKECDNGCSDGSNEVWPGVEKIQEMYQSYLHGSPII